MNAPRPVAATDPPSRVTNATADRVADADGLLVAGEADGSSADDLATLRGALAAYVAADLAIEEAAANTNTNPGAERQRGDAFRALRELSRRGAPEPKPAATLGDRLRALHEGDLDGADLVAAVAGATWAAADPTGPEGDPSPA